MHAFGNKRIKVVMNPQGIMVVYKNYLFPMRKIEKGLRMQFGITHEHPYKQKELLAYMFLAAEDYINSMIASYSKELLADVG